MDQQPGTGALMFIAHRSIESRVLDTLRADGYELTLAQCRIGQRLSPDGIRITALAEQAQITKQTASALVDELERGGYVRREPDPADARARLVVLTDRGQQLCRRAAEEIARIEAEWARHLGAQRYQQLREALVSLREITDPYQ